MGWREEFPDFSETDMPTPIPDGFEDSSWHNDACPSFTSERLGLQIFIDYADLNERECPGNKRFTLFDTDSNVIFDNDDWNAFLHYIADAESELQRQAPAQPLKSQLEQAADLLETAFGLLGGEPDDDWNTTWFKETEAFIKRVRGIPECAEVRADEYGADPIDDRAVSP